jgi:hypothetical protein
LSLTGGVGGMNSRPYEENSNVSLIEQGIQPCPFHVHPTSR